MSIQQPDEPAATTARLVVDCSVSVSRDADGDLTDGVRARLASADGVDAVESLQIGGLEPGLNDLTVEATAELRVDADVDAPTLESTFGICDVTTESRKGPPDTG